jgi:hypothetical protein
MFTEAWLERLRAPGENDEPIDADFTDVPTQSGSRKLPKPKVVKLRLSERA